MLTDFIIDFLGLSMLSINISSWMGNHLEICAYIIAYTDRPIIPNLTYYNYEGVFTLFITCL